MHHFLSLTNRYVEGWGPVVHFVVVRGGAYKDLDDMNHGGLKSIVTLWNGQDRFPVEGVLGKLKRVFVLFILLHP